MQQTEKIAFITGANRGLGFETAKELAQKGITVIVGSRDDAKGQEAVEKLKNMGLKAMAFQFDVNNSQDHQKIYDFIDTKFGKLDILINNAAVMLDKNDKEKNNTSTISQDILRKTFDSNFFDVIALTQKLLPLLKKAPSGRIVNLSSILGSLTLHSDPNSPIYETKAFAYNASKTALNAFTVHLAHDLKDTNVKVNSVHPGWVKTDMGGENAPMEISEGGKTSVLLATIDESGPTGGFYHFGQTLPW